MLPDPHEKGFEVQLVGGSTTPLVPAAHRYDLQMGSRNYLVEGVSGTGKTSVCHELQRRGYHAINGDRELAYQGDPTTGEPTRGVGHEHHIWNVEKVKAVIASQDEAETFFCGGSRNFSEFIDLFDGVFVLVVDLETLNRRLAGRPEDEWGGRPAERELVERLHQSGEGTPNGIVIDATAPLARVVDEILRRCQDHPAAEASGRAEGRVSTMWVMVGLPSAGKTSRASELASTWNALRLTPDEWMIPLFGQDQPEGKRNVLAGRLIWLALSALRVGVNVVLDFGVWARVERSALRALAASVGATSELVYLPVDGEEQWRRVKARALTDAATTFAMTRADLERWRPTFQPPDATELAAAHLDPPPAGFDSWEAWVAQWWPTSLPGYGSAGHVLG